MGRMEITQTTIALLRCFLVGERFEGELSEELRGEVYALAGKHDVAHLICVVLEREGLLEKNDLFQSAKQQSVFRYVRQEYERERMYALLESVQIPFIPLKGSVISGFYPEPWQRTSCDIDILVHEEDLGKAVELFERELNYAAGGKSEHDISLMSSGGVHIELHYDLHEEEVPVEKAWTNALPSGEGSSRMILSGEEFIFHHIAHMAKHFRNGGCGLRPFMDLWFLREKMPFDEKVLRDRLHIGKLEKFADVIFGLLDYWFGDGAPSPVLEATANYIVPAGVYGSVKNRVAVGQVRRGNKLQYFFSRLYLGKETMKYPYPILEKHGWLLPFCQMHRWCKLLLTNGKVKRIAWELETNGAMEKSYKDAVADLLDELEL